jgi:cholesterol oxidase
MSDDLQHYDADFVVIGSGFGGSVSALRLAEKGYKVIVLEQGKRYERSDFPETSWGLKKYLWMPRFGWGGIQAVSFFRHMLVLHGTGVGGGSLVYANNLIHPPAQAFGEDEWGDPDWVGRLEPHYAEARRMLGASPCEGLGRTDELLEQVAAEMPGSGTLRASDVGVFFGESGVEVADPYFGGEGPRRTGCTRCGACMIGCRVGAKNTLDRNYLWFAERLGVEIVPETRVTGIEPREGGYTVHVRDSLRRDPGRRSWRAKQVVVAGGVLGSVHLLLRSRDKGWLPDLSPRIGEFVRTNSEELLVVESKDRTVDLGDHVAITSGLQADANTFVEMVRLNRGSDVLFGLTAPLAGVSRLPRAVAPLVAALSSVPRFLLGLWPFGRASRSAILLAMQPTEGHLSLVLQRRWLGLGRAVLKSELPIGEKPPAVRIPVAREIARRLAEKMNGTVWQSLWIPFAGSPTTAHVLGGCRMSDTPDDGVVDRAGRVHGHRGLYVADGSVVPSNLGVNPSLTITALAEYIMAQVPGAGEAPTSAAPEDD